MTDNISVPTSYMVTGGSAWWYEWPANSRQIWYAAPITADGRVSWADTSEIDLHRGDAPVCEFVDKITDKWLFINSAAGTFNVKMELYDLIHAVNNALGMPVADHVPGQAMGQIGVGWTMAGFTFDIMQDNGDGESAWITCHNPADINSVPEGTPMEMVDQYPGPFDASTWRSPRFQAWVKDCTFRVLATRDFMNVQASDIRRAEFATQVQVA